MFDAQVVVLKTKLLLPVMELLLLLLLLFMVMMESLLLKHESRLALAFLRE